MTTRGIRPLILAGAVGAAVLAGCTPAPTGVTGPCPTPPEIAAGTGDAAWFEQTEAIVDSYAQQLRGFDEDAAQACVEGAGLAWRVVARDGEFFAVTADYTPQRVNAVIERRVVTTLSVG